jgi:uncharacterized membrane protein
MLVGLVAGATFGIWQGYNPTGYSPAAFVQVHQGTVRGLNVLLPVIGITGAVLVAVLTLLSRQKGSVSWLYATALVLILAAGLITRFFNQPINATVMNWSVDAPPPNWAALRDHWWTWHVVRTWVSLAAQAILIVAVLTDWAKPISQKRQS